MREYRLDWLTAQVIEATILRVIPICAIIGIILPLVLGYSNLSVLGLYLGVPMIIAPIIYTRYRNNGFESIQLEGCKFRFLTIIYFFSFTASVILLYAYEIRPYTYYVASTITVTIVLLEILLFNPTPKKSAVILLQIMAIALNLILGFTLNVHYYIGNADAMCHIWWIKSLLTSGCVTDVFGIYEAFPLWHILVSSLYLVSNPFIPVNKVMFFVNGVIYSFAILILYRISLKIFQNEKIALLSALLLCIYPDFIFYGMESISRSVVNILVLLFILILLRRKNVSDRLLIIVLALALIAYHTASMPFIITILFLVYLFQYFFVLNSEDWPVKLHILVLLAISTLAYWIYVSVDIFRTFIESFKMETPSGVLTQSIVDAPLNEVFNYLQFTPLLLFVILGCIWALECRKIGTLGKAFCSIGLFFTAVAFPGPVLLINKLAENMNIGRFGEYVMLFVVVAGAVGLFIVYMRTKRSQKFLIIALVAVMCFLSISNDFIASDNPLVKRPYYTNYFTEEDIVSFERVANNTIGYVMADYVADWYIYRSIYSEKSHLLEIDAENHHLLRDKPDDVFLIREGELTKRPVKLYSSPTHAFILKPEWNILDYYYADHLVWSTLDSYNKIFDSSNIIAVT